MGRLDVKGRAAKNCHGRETLTRLSRIQGTPTVVAYPVYSAV